MASMTSTGLIQSVHCSIRPSFPVVSPHPPSQVMVLPHLLFIHHYVLPRLLMTTPAVTVTAFEMAVIRCERLSQLADLVFPHLTCLCAWVCLCLCMFDQWSLLRLFNCTVHYQKKERFAWLSTSDAKKILQAFGLRSGNLPKLIQ